ncbi:MAG: hypothetical protein P1P85_03385 [Patescibacteria group bacterium]|nr:hypothetical protein [Patescibacteria group bacterium]
MICLNSEKENHNDIFAEFLKKIWNLEDKITLQIIKEKERKHKKS